MELASAGAGMTDGVQTLYVDGKWAAAASGNVFEVTDPATGDVIGHGADAGAIDAEQAIEAATAAFAGWSRRTAYERSEVLYRAHAIMTARADELARLMTREQGKPLRAARNEVNYGADFLIWFAEEAKRVHGTTIPAARADQRFTVLRQPVGVVAGITPWNYPISMITRKVAPAVAAGCTIILKPAEQTPLCAVEMFKIFEEAGMPPGVVNLLTTNHPAEVADPLLSSPAVRKLTFTGSTEVGIMLAARAAATMKRVSLELGGHAPFIVLPDADIARAAKGAAMVKFLNTGQACISPNRIYVHRSRMEEFLDVLVGRVSKMRTGSGFTDGVSIGPLIDDQAMEKMERQVGDATSKGAAVLAGGGRLTEDDLARGRFYAPTVLTGVTRDMRIYREETFGPIAAVIAFDDEEEVITAANDTTYGLASYLYTTNIAKATRISEALQFGIVGINDINPTAAAAPFGGVKFSGLGREGGVQGIDEYLDTKLIGLSLD
jgi:succinate-semialdehyde dehydrogenase / glutarate-semialdehyde dehydrogenase